MRTKAETFLKTGIAAWLLFCGGHLSIHGATLPAGFTEANWGNSIGSNCTAMAFAPDGRLFVCQQNGALRVIDAGGTLLPTAFVNLTVDSNGERGLLGVAFDPNFSSNQFVYVYHTVPAGPPGPAPTPPPHNRITRFTANGNVAAGAGTTILDLDNLTTAQNHNGGAIHFGPDGKLYVGVGENANGANAQSLSNRLGKILRINSNGTNPTDPANPTTFPGIAGATTGVNQAIWAVGLRNPFTFAFQPGTTRMFINDVGQNTWEEINDGIAGRNYGWPTSEGPDNLGASFTGPLFSYGHGTPGTTTGCAIVGGAFYNPAVLQFPASFLGKYFFGDLCSDWIRVLDPSNNTAAGFATAISGALVDLQIGPDGALYYLVQSGQVRRVQATPSQALNISTRARVETGQNVLIGGFIVTGSAAKKVIVRAIGPSLSSVPDRLADPVLELRGPPPGHALIRSNDNWQDDPSQASEISANQLAPRNTLESALVETLQPGNYTAIVTGKDASSGVGLAEIYDVSSAASSQLANLSGRSFVRTGPNVMIGGFIVGNNIGAARVIVRAIGPSLASQGINNPLADPTLRLHDGNGALLISNDNWQDDPDQAARIIASDLEPSNSLESAISASLAPGNYTAIVEGKDGGTGIGLVEVYKLP